MFRFATWVQEVVLPLLGSPGIFLATFLDSSFLSLPEIGDILVVASAVSQPTTAWLPVLLATLGSVAGCSALWWVGQRGGESLLVRRFGSERAQRARSAFHRWGGTAIAVPAMMPPPMPFKLFVVAAGVFGYPWPRFALTVFLARGARYVAWALLGALYGNRALVMLRAFDGWAAGQKAVIFAVAAALGLALVAYLWTRRRARLATGV